MAAKKNDENGFAIKRGEVKDDFTPKQAGRTSKLVELWEDEIMFLRVEHIGQVVTYEDVPKAAQTASQLKANFEGVDARSRSVDQETGVGRLEIRVSA